MAKRTALTDEQKIAAYLKRHKPTRCPTAFLAPSQHAEPTARDAAAHTARGLDPVNGPWHQQSKRARRQTNRKRALGAAKASQTRRRNRNG